LRMSRHKGRKPTCFSTVPLSIPKRVVPGGILIVGSRFAICGGEPEPAAPAAASVGDFEEESKDPVEDAEDVVDAGLSPEPDKITGDRTALAFGAISAGAIGFASLVGVGWAKSGVTDEPCGSPALPRGFETKSCGAVGAT